MRVRITTLEDKVLGDQEQPILVTQQSLSILFGAGPSAGTRVQMKNGKIILRIESEMRSSVSVVTTYDIISLDVVRMKDA